jgi:beta-lactamase class A
MRLVGLVVLLIFLKDGRAEEVRPFSEFERAITTLVRGAPFKVSVAIKDLTSGEELLINADESLPIGSSVRVHLISELYRQASAGRLNVAEVRPLPESARTGGLGVLRFMGKGTVAMSLRDYATLVVTAADNTAANFLTDVVGMEAVNSSLQRDGLGKFNFAAGQ